MKNPLDEFCDKVEEMMGKTGAGGEGPGAEFRRNFRALASAFFARMNLVSREEFDAQSVALGRAMERMETLERQIRELRGERGEAKPKSGGKAKRGGRSASSASSSSPSSSSSSKKNPPRE